MILLLILTVLCVTPVFARKKKQPTEVVVQADTLPPVPIPVVTPEAKTATPISVVPVTEPKKEETKTEHLNELKLALDRVASLEQKNVVLESKLSAVEQKLGKVEAQLTTFINELSAPTPEEQEALPTSAGMVAVDEDEDGEDEGMSRML